MAGVELGQVTAPVETELRQVEALLEKELFPGAEGMVPLLNHVTGFRGKMLRPAQVLLVGKVLGRFSTEHVKVATIVELIHTATLVHDDILDDAEVRRKLPSIHNIYGVEASVLTGDYIYAVAFSLSTTLEDRTCSRVLARTTRTICQGEITQILAKGKADLSEEAYYEIIGAKTASLYGAACELGAHYAGADGDTKASFRRFGYDLGMAFQIVDDCLDLEGEEESVGKTLGSDIDKGKMTLPLIFLYHNADPERKKLFSNIFADDSPGRRKKAVEEIFELDEGLRYAKKKARHFASRALKALNSEWKGEAVDSLKKMAEYILERDR